MAATRVTGHLTSNSLGTRVPAKRGSRIKRVLNSLRLVARHVVRIVGRTRRTDGNVVAVSDRLRSSTRKLFRNGSGRTTKIRRALSTVGTVSTVIGRGTSGTGRACRSSQRSIIVISRKNRTIDRAVRIVRSVVTGVGVVRSVTRRAGLLTLGTTVRTTHTKRRNGKFKIITGRVQGLTRHDHVTTRRVAKLTSHDVTIDRHAKRLFRRVIPDVRTASTLVTAVTRSDVSRGRNVRRVDRTVIRLSRIARSGTTTTRRLTTSDRTVTARAGRLRHTVTCFGI